LAVPRASGPVFIFCALGHIFGNAEAVGSRFLVLRSRTCFRRCGGRQVPFSCFVHLDSFSVVPSCFHVLLSRTRFRRYRGRQVSFSSYACPDCIEVVGSHFHVLRSRICFCRCGGRRLLFSCFAHPYAFSAVQTASGPIFMYCDPSTIFGGAEGVGYCVQVLHARTHFRWNRGYHAQFSCLGVPRASAPDFMFCAPGLVFLLYDGRLLPFSCFALPDMLLAMRRA
jgi:hypothetical protein